MYSLSDPDIRVNIAAPGLFSRQCLLYDNPLMEPQFVLFPACVGCLSIRCVKMFEDRVSGHLSPGSGLSNLKGKFLLYPVWRLYWKGIPISLLVDWPFVCFFKPFKIWNAIQIFVTICLNSRHLFWRSDNFVYHFFFNDISSKDMSQLEIICC